MVAEKLMSLPGTKDNALTGGRTARRVYSRRPASSTAEPRMVRADVITAASTR